MEYLSLVLLHIFFGAIWAGGAIATGFFIVPAVLDAGPAGGPVMAGVAKRKFPTVMSVAAVLTVLAGIRLYSIRYAPGWVASKEGIVLSLGALLGIGAFVMGVFIQKPIVERLGALGARIAASGAPPTPEQAAEVQALRAKLRRIAALVAWHLVGAVLLMASHRLAAGL